ncbi:hypothetical protein OIU79_030132 [Salix purpurea]|uniref:Uncharacterized protein n=1 Tax=Salix purpurea TaxID=77065 RepID=A0A9Q0VI12_SALPP|nr:hypothetical protein OIU79_030132 [Salix purpurea]
MTSRRSEDRKKPATGCCIFLEKAVFFFMFEKCIFQLFRYIDIKN